MDAKQHLAEARRRAKRRFGPGFELLGGELQKAVVCAEVVAIIGAMASFEDTAAGQLATLTLQYYD